ncbi:CoA transferase [Streptomyces netropsis]|uniref:Crotonobetainyl-CoA:carnitine CoA-transferase CaiB-like acyl-CoA transferase n=1 Tax=Streptomyces netropsis TaxID=55404 RepID=A0A7W7PH17_STRNE|nr:CoA transferase [Streptomyces netropsis]MBB4888320.1 crotonobetainyl-CoA:carnitine CoA-transferase CaiB-like acyl-CoA transferase [Streptomyces netropsis]GGR30119.1 putative L-carnitine dehydratase [Streptomyces netropsis]
MIKRATDATDQAWAALGGDPALPAGIDCTGPADTLAAALPVRELARATVAVCALAAAELRTACDGGGRLPAVRVDDGAVATAFVSERHLRVDGRAASTFAPLSRFWRSADGWVRTHANYPHHRARLLAALDVRDVHEGADESDVEARVAAALAELPSERAEEEIYAAGGLAVAVRTPREWAAHPQGAAAARRPLLSVERIAGGPVRALSGIDRLRVLDLTRVIAGPVAGRTLALLGADVLRVDPPQLPESQDAHADTGFGKRSTTLDLARTADRATFEALLADADVVLSGYRPGTLDRYGLAPKALAERRPGLVIGQLSAWGGYGPWGGRRGFDSLVQAACGIAVTEAGPDGRPGALPAQALDHGTGYLLAAAVLRAVTEQRTAGGTHLARLALTQTAAWLTGGTITRDGGGATRTYETGEWLSERDSPLGRLRYALPPVSFDGGPRDWARPPGRWGTDVPRWS